MSGIAVKFIISLSFLVMVLTVNNQAMADQYHYQNVLIGDRAIGLGGAYAGVSDDASGVFYNPAGLAFALSNDISGSANAFYSKEYTYKKTFCDFDYVENSSGSLPSFFGGLQKLDDVADGLVFAFGIYAIDQELRDQNDIFENCDYGNARISRLHRAQNMRASTFFYTAAAAMRITSNFSVGLALSFFQVDELFQDYQDIRILGASGSDIIINTTSQNVRQQLEATGLEPNIGVQWAATSRLSIGLNIRKGMYFSQKYSFDGESRRIQENNSTTPDENGYRDGKILTGISKFEKDEPLGDMPLKMRAGMALFATTRLLWTLDVMYFGASKAPDSQGLKLYDRESVLNYATGVEYYMTPTMPIRAGFFTNNDARPEVVSGKTDQLDHVDFMGMTLFLAWTQPNSQISFGVVQQIGSGKAQKVGGIPDIQDVEASSRTWAFSATHNF